MQAVRIVLAHGALGNFDELIFLGIGVVFVGLMVWSWLKSRNAARDDAADAPVPADDSAPRSDVEQHADDHHPLR